MMPPHPVKPLLPVNGEIVFPAGVKQPVDLDPAARCRLQPKPLRLMPQMLAEIPADFYKAFAVQNCALPPAYSAWILLSRICLFDIEHIMAIE
jgi:hypothetical protein